MTHPLTFRVYLPPCYDVNEDERYPVLYLLHGQSFNDDQWDRLGADEALDELIADGEARPFIIVMPKESNYMIDQWTSKYGPALAEELVPWIDAHYRTQAERSKRAIGGLSRGAAWAMRTGLIYWDVFGAMAAIPWRPSAAISTSLLLVPKNPGDPLPRIWMTWAPKISSPTPPKSSPGGWRITTSPSSGTSSTARTWNPTGRRTLRITCAGTRRAGSKFQCASRKIPPKKVAAVIITRMTLTLKEVEHIALLARLELTPEEKERYQQQLSAILDHVAQLQALDTSSIQTTSSVLPPQPPARG